MTPTRLSRRAFLRASCLTAGAASLTVCGITAFSPEATPIEAQSITYGVNQMNKRILIAYATCTGSTVEVASTIGETLGKNAVSVEVKPIEAELQVEGYQAVLIGSAVQYGDWLPEAVEFVQTNQQALNRLPLALFCVHIRNTANDPASRQNRLAYLDHIRPLVQPVAEGFFAGRFDRRGAALLLPKWAARFVPPIDLRKWDKMRDWAEAVQPLLI